MNTETSFSGTEHIAAKSPAASAPDAAVDITHDVCPMTFVRTRLALDRLKPGQTLLVTLRGAEPLRNVPRTAAAQGHTVLSLETGPDGVSRLLLRRGP
jgi:tRNA 2-thiouridine synthesizing protein A